MVQLVHELSVQVAKRLFLDREQEVVLLLEDTPVEVAAQAGLEPVLIFAVVVGPLRRETVWLSPWTSPARLDEFLVRSWRSEQLLGVPDVLQVNEPLRAAAPWLQSFCDRHGVELQTTPKGDRNHRAGLRCAQDKASQVDWLLLGEAPRKRLTIDDVHRLGGWSECRAFFDGPRDRALLDLLLARPVRACAAEALRSDEGQLDDKRFCLLYQGAFAPRSVRSISVEAERWHKRLRGLPQEPEPDRQPIDEDDLYDDFGEDPGEATDRDGRFAGVQAAASLARCWPGGLQPLAAAAGITVKELRWFLTNRRDLDDEVAGRLFDAMGLIPDPREPSGIEYVLDSPVMLFAGTKASTADAYAEASTGGDVFYTAEVIAGDVDTARGARYLLLYSCGAETAIFAFERGSTAEALLDEAGEAHQRTLLNYSGRQIVSPALYAELQRLHSEVAQHPTEMLRLVRNSFHRHERLYPRVWD